MGDIPPPRQSLLLQVWPHFKGLQGIRLNLHQKTKSSWKIVRSLLRASGHGSGADPETDPEQPEEPEKPEEPAEPKVKPDKNGVILPAEYKGFTIEANKNGYFYMNAAGKKVYCGFKGWKNEADSLIIDFWYDSSTNYFVPMVVEVTKK